MALSDLAVRRAKATGKDYTLPDTLGLSLAVAATGGKTWHFRYYWCWRQFKFDHLCQLNFDQGLKTGFVVPGCG